MFHWNEEVRLPSVGVRQGRLISKKYGTELGLVQFVGELHHYRLSQPLIREMSVLMFTGLSISFGPSHTISKQGQHQPSSNPQPPTMHLHQ